MQILYLNIEKGHCMEGIGEYDCLEQVCKSDRDAAKGGAKEMGEIFQTLR